MARETITFGLALCAATVIGLLTADTARTTTIFVPMVFGIPLFIVGIICLNPHRRRFWGRVAVGIATLGALCSIARVGFICVRLARGGPIDPVATVFAVALATSLIVYAVLTYRWIRKRKREGVIGNGDKPSRW